MYARYGMSRQHYRVANPTPDVYFTPESFTTIFVCLGVFGLVMFSFSLQYIFNGKKKLRDPKYVTIVLISLAVSTTNIWYLFLFLISSDLHWSASGCNKGGICVLLLPHRHHPHPHSVLRPLLHDWVPWKRGKEAKEPIVHQDSIKNIQ